MGENEPEIYEAVSDIAEAVSAEDEAMIEAGMQKLKVATQLLNPEYPPMPPEKRDVAGKQIAKHLRDKGHPAKDTPSWKQAVAIGLSEARQGNPEEGAESPEFAPPEA